jgi:uncharacterized protein (TIGR03435 family)
MSGQLSFGARDLPNGGFSASNLPTEALIRRAYSILTRDDLLGLPDWAKTERYDVAATSSDHRVTAEDMRLKLQAVLSDRFKLVVHSERREQQIYELVLARDDRRLGPNLISVSTLCDSTSDERRPRSDEYENRPKNSGRGRSDLSEAPPPCTLRVLKADLRAHLGASSLRDGESGDLLEGDVTIDTLATALRIPAGRPVINRTGLLGVYRVRLNLDMQSAFRGPNVVGQGDLGPSVFTALPEQLGLKLRSARGERDVLVIERIERPEPD